MMVMDGPSSTTVPTNRANDNEIPAEMQWPSTKRYSYRGSTAAACVISVGAAATGQKFLCREAQVPTPAVSHRPIFSSHTRISLYLTYIYLSFLTSSFFYSTAPAAASSTSLAVSVKVDVGEGESIEQALRRFKREVNKSGHLMELRHRRYFENSQQKKKRKVKEARMRIRMERMQRRRMNRQMA